MTKIKFIIIKPGVTKLNIEIIPNFSGIRLGVKKEIINNIANTLFIKKMNLLTEDNFFIDVTTYQYYFFPTENKKSFSSLVKVS